MVKLPAYIDLQGWELNLRTGELVTKRGKTVELNKAQLGILTCLLQNTGRLVLKDDLITAGWGEDVSVQPNSLNKVIQRLRTILGRHVVGTVHGKGYRLVLSQPIPKDRTITAGEELIQVAPDECHLHEIPFAADQSPAKVADYSADRVISIPHTRRSFLASREQELDELHRVFRHSDSHTPVVAILHGPNGVGKSRCALEYCYEHISEYSIIWWFSVVEPAAVVFQYHELSKRIWPKMSAHSIQHVMGFLARAANWLLIFDDAANFHQIKSFLPIAGRGSIIITSINPNWEDYGAVIEVRPLSRENAVSFLLARTAQNDHGSADEICEFFGDLPLGIAAAGSYIRTTRVSLRRYVDFIRSAPHGILTKDHDLPDYDRPIIKAWERSLRAIKESSVLAWEVINALAYMSNTPVPLAIFLASPKILSNEDSGTRFDIQLREAVAELHKYSLIEIEGEAKISCHVMTQRAVRFYSESDYGLELALLLLSERFIFRPDPEYSHFDNLWASEYLAHQVEVTNHSIARGVKAGLTLDLLNGIAWYYVFYGKLLNAEVLLERASKLDKQLCDAENDVPAGILTMRLIAHLREQQHRAEEAEWSCKIALNRSLKSSAPPFYRWEMAMELAELQFKHGKLVAACESAKQAYKLAKARHGWTSAAAIECLARCRWYFKRTVAYGIPEMPPSITSDVPGSRSLCRSVVVLADRIANDSPRNALAAELARVARLLERTDAPEQVCRSLRKIVRALPSDRHSDAVKAFIPDLLKWCGRFRELEGAIIGNRPPDPMPNIPRDSGNRKGRKI
ncbi:MAG TPA: winged helix-turn-helix domain-containing protein [Candidatus Angelobacter sp.]